MIDNGLKGRVALVAGGSGGIGRNVALTLAQEGVDVVICARKKTELDEAAREISLEAGRTVMAIQADMTSVEDVKRLVSVLQGLPSQRYASASRCDSQRYGNPARSVVSERRWRHWVLRTTNQEYSNETANRTS